MRALTPMTEPAMKLLFPAEDQRHTCQAHACLLFAPIAAVYSQCFIRRGGNPHGAKVWHCCMAPLLT